MSLKGDFEDSDKSDFSEKLSPDCLIPASDKEISLSSLLSREGFQPARQLPKRSYSLEPDLATGWKPKKISSNMTNNVFPINFSSEIVDYLVKELYRRKFKQYEIAYLGPRQLNSYLLHENKKYQNPYPLSKKLDPQISQRPQIPLQPELTNKNLVFNSDFECGNLDAAIFVSNNEYDLFMRVDSNTKGHTNWYFFTVQNFNFVGTVRFNICNFRREKSLYQRGLKPYYFSRKTSESWRQGGQNVRYQKKPLRYSFLYEDEDHAQMLKNYITLTFTYHFQTPNDLLEFAYFIPYSYSRLLKFITPLPNCRALPPLKSLTGLPVPVLEVTDQQAEDHNKKVLILTARIHPGQANSSFVCEGFLQYICSEQPRAKQFRKNFIAFVIPMVNPDGVVAGNYRTSLFGKDLNRTFHESRKFAFPQSYHLLELIKDLKGKFKQRLNLFIDLHGHSVKKNVFMYGPEFNIQHPNYYLAKQLPRILSNLTPCFRFYSCIFKISSQKATTARATLNRLVSIPFTYTMQSSNGFYYDAQSKKELELTSKKLKKIGVALCQALLVFKEIEINRSSLNLNTNLNLNNKIKVVLEQEKPYISYQNNLFASSDNDHKIDPNMAEIKVQNSREPDSISQTGLHQSEYQIQSDDNISEGNSDSQPSDEDLSDTQLDKLLQTIQEGRQHQEKLLRNINQGSLQSPQQKDNNPRFFKLTERQPKQKGRYKKKNPLLPPINCLNRAKAKQKTTKSFLQKIQKPEKFFPRSPDKQRRSKHLSISQMIEQAKVDFSNLTSFKQKQILMGSPITKKKTSKIELDKIKFLPNPPYNIHLEK